MTRKKEGRGMVAQLKNYIRQSGQSLRELEKSSGVDRGQLSRFLRGERDLTGASIERICQALDLRLVQGTGEAAPATESRKSRKGK